MPPQSLPTPGGATLRGRLLRPDGTPTVGASVWVEPAEGSRGGEIYGSTKADGTYLLDGVGEGTWRVRASGGDTQVDIAKVTVGSEGTPEIAVADGLLPPPSEAWLAASVRIVGPDGATVPFAKVVVHLPSSPSGGARAAWLAGFVDVVDGAFRRLEPVPPGTTYLIFGASSAPNAPPFGYAPAVYAPEADAAGPAQVRLAAGLTIEGRVEDDEGRAVPGADVLAHISEKHPGDLDHTSTDAAGEFVLRGVGPEPVFVTARKAGPYIARGVSTTVPGGWRAVRLVLRKGRDARILVLDASGHPVPGARVGTGSSFVATDAEGIAVLVGLDPAAELRLQVEPPTVRTDLQSYVLTRWKASDVTIQFERGYLLRGRVVGVDGATPMSAIVQRLIGRDWTPVSGSARDGTFQIRGLSAGPLVLRASGFLPDSPKGTPVEVADLTTEVLLVLPKQETPPLGR